jgi:hypothetical protein
VGSDLCPTSSVLSFPVVPAVTETLVRIGHHCDISGSHGGYYEDDSFLGYLEV